MSQKNFTNATGNWTVGSDDHINYSSSAKLEGTIQATDFLDADGNSIVIDVSKYLPATFYPEYEYETFGTYADKEDVWETTNLAANWLYAPVFQAGRSHFSEQISSVLGLSSNITYGFITGALGGFTEVIALGGISIPASAEDLPFSIDEEEREGLENKTRSIQKAFTVTHETLGRTVEIDKEGIIRANAFTDMDGNPIVDVAGYLKSEDSFLVDYNAERTPLDIVSWNINDTYDGFESDFKISWGPKYYPSINTKLRGTMIEADETGLGLYCGTGEDSSAVYLNQYGVTTIAPSKVQFMTPTVIMPDATGASSDAKVAIKLERDKASYFKFPIQAADFLDADGNSIIGSGGESLWTEDDDGSITRVGASKGRLAVGQWAGSVNQGQYSTAYGMGTGMENQGGWATALGWSAGMENQGEYAVAVGGGAGSRDQGEGAIAIGNNAGTQDQGAYGIIISSDGWNPENNTVEGHIVLNSTKGSLKFNGTDKWTFDGGPVQATDYLDAAGNSIKVDLSNYYTSTESNSRYQPAGSYAAANHNHNGVYQPAGNYQPEGNYPQSTTVNTFVTLSQAQYDALSSKDPNTIYFIQE